MGAVLKSNELLELDALHLIGCAPGVCKVFTFLLRGLV
jgi:hypothetical protein